MVKDGPVQSRALRSSAEAHEYAIGWEAMRRAAGGDHRRWFRHYQATRRTILPKCSLDCIRR